MEETKKLTKYLHQGDVVRICVDANCTPRTYYQMQKATSIDAMPPAQRRAFDSLLKYVKLRQAEAAKITSILSQIAQI